METATETDRQMLKMTTTGNHTDSQALGEVHHSLVDDVFWWQLFPDCLHGDCQLICHLRLRLDFIVFFQHGVSDMKMTEV